MSTANSAYERTLVSIRNGQSPPNPPADRVADRVAVLLPSNFSKKDRGFFHSAVKESFPFLITASMNPKEFSEQNRLFSEQFKEFSDLPYALSNTCTDVDTGTEVADVEIPEPEVTEGIPERILQNIPESIPKNIPESILQNIPNNISESSTHSENVIGIWVYADYSLFELAHTAMSIADISLLYAFKGRGPHHSGAREGVRIGLGLSRDERTKVYRIITSKCASLDSKTGDSGYNNNNNNNICYY